MVLKYPLPVFEHPPNMVAPQPLAVFKRPPETLVAKPVALFWNPPPIDEYVPALQAVGATVNMQLAKLHVPPQVLLPTPPTTTAPVAKHSLVELQAKLQLPPNTALKLPCAVLPTPHLTDELQPVPAIITAFPPRVYPTS
jgi:hypothetical protein